MQIEDYFDFLTANDIRIKGSRIGIETLLHEYMYCRQTPEEIAQLYPHLTLEQIYATILYYLQNPETITQYMADWLNHCQEGAKQQDENPPDYVLRLRQFKAERG
ncbi:MAG: DUF433 domain-containing protein [Coleofasciculus chthonoplastes F3-SA18-01]|uniref:DUF433 domain-containing protein n=1 Tax=Coleofasciculus chthonoplastes TaxID=64178 RepID=UPI0032FD2BE8